MKTKLTDITDVVRSKNSGPYELTDGYYVQNL